MRTWKLATDEDGYIDFLNPKVLPGSDEFYRNANNKRSIPVGTIVIEETTAPTGFIPTDDKYVMTIQLDEGGKRATETLYDANGKMLGQQSRVDIDKEVDLDFGVVNESIAFDINITKRCFKVTPLWYI